MTHRIDFVGALRQHPLVWKDGAGFSEVPDCLHLRNYTLPGATGQMWRRSRWATCNCCSICGQLISFLTLCWGPYFSLFAGENWEHGTQAWALNMQSLRIFFFFSECARRSSWKKSLFYILAFQYVLLVVIWFVFHDQWALIATFTNNLRYRKTELFSH